MFGELTNKQVMEKIGGKQFTYFNNILVPVGYVKTRALSKFAAFEGMGNCIFYNTNINNRISLHRPIDYWIRVAENYPLTCDKFYGWDAYGHTVFGGTLWDLYQSSSSHVVETTEFPHKCPTCSAPAYIGFSRVDCSKGCGR